MSITIRELEPEKLLIRVKGKGLGLLTDNVSHYKPPPVGSKGQKDTRTTDQKFVDSMYPLKPKRDKCQYGIPARAFRSALVTAGKSKITRTSGAQANRIFQIEGGPDGLVPIISEHKPVALTLMGCNPNSSGGRGAPIPITRAHWPEWECNVVVVLNGATAEDTIELFQVAGIVSGVGAFRQENGGDYGKFEVLKAEWLHQKKEDPDAEESS